MFGRVSERVAKAFTLAEVLITLVIIGVIAAITIPTLINKTQNQEFVSKLKKTYSTLAQATNLIIAEEGTPKASVGGWASSQENIYSMYRKHLLNAKECGSEAGCFRNGTIKYLNGNNYGDFDNGGGLILSDGTQVQFEYMSSACSSTYYGSSNRCAMIWVDLNGEKKPNQMGRDIFRFALKEKGLYPSGCDREGYCNGPNDTRGWGCACKVLREGAINY